MGRPRFRLGTQSWTYFPDWLGPFYPPDMPHADALGFYATVFDTVEVNATFHAIPRERTVDGWRERTPDGFVFALKMPQAVTHEARLELEACRPVVEAFLAAAERLDGKLGPVLVQLPPSFDRTAASRVTLAAFLDFLLPRCERVALELRHPSWVDAAVERALADRNVAWVLADGGRNSRAAMFTADFAYVRWGRSGVEFPDFGEIRLDRSDDLDWWAGMLAAVPPRVGTVYGYMCDEFAGHAPGSVRMLQARLGLGVVEPRERWPQQPLF